MSTRKLNWVMNRNLNWYRLIENLVKAELFLRNYSFSTILLKHIYSAKLKLVCTFNIVFFTAIWDHLRRLSAKMIRFDCGTTHISVAINGFIFQKLSCLDKNISFKMFTQYNALNLDNFDWRILPKIKYYKNQLWCFLLCGVDVSL